MTTLGGPPAASPGSTLGGPLSTPPTSSHSPSPTPFAPTSIPASTKAKNARKNARKKANKGNGNNSGPRSYVVKTHRENEYSSEEEEEEEEYRKGGYHPVQLGNVFDNRYKVMSKLGWGHFSTVWLAKDLKEETEVALKIVKSAAHYTDAAKDEVEILNTVAKSDGGGNCVIRLLNDFLIGGVHGTHVSMVFEKLGCNLLTLIRMYRYRGLPIPVVRMVTKQMAMGIAYLHRCHIIHTDLKPENLLLVKTPRLIKEMSRDKKKELTHLHRPPPGDDKGRADSGLDGEARGSAPHDNGTASGNGADKTAADGKLSESGGFSSKAGEPLAPVSESKRDSDNSETDDAEDPASGAKLNSNGKFSPIPERKLRPQDGVASEQLLRDSFVNHVNPRLMKSVDQHSRVYHGNWGSPVVTPAGSPLGSPRGSFELAKNSRTSPSPLFSLTKNMRPGSMTSSTSSTSKRSALSVSTPPVAPTGDQTPGNVYAESTPIIPTPPATVLIVNDATAKSPPAEVAEEGEVSSNKKRGKAEDSPKSVRKRLKLPWEPAELKQAFNSSCKVKIVDLGNACWTYKHFTDDVQTRQYRAPEVILGAKYDQAIDVWSMACIVFELITGDLLFEPKAGRSFDKNDDHLAQMQELLGRFPRHIALNGRNSRSFFTRRGDLRYIKNLKFWYLENVLLEKYKFPAEEASQIAGFLLPMLTVDPRARISSKEVLQQPWIKDIDPDNFDSAF